MRLILCVCGARVVLCTELVVVASSGGVVLFFVCVPLVLLGAARARVWC